MVLDLGTGLRFWGLDLPCDGSLDAIALVSHLHWDHVQGIPFFGPINVEGARLEVYGLATETGSLGDAIAGFMRPPYFPVTLDALRGSFDFRDAAPGDVIRSGGWTIGVGEVPHVGETLGFRIEHGGVTVAYVPDHQQPGCQATDVDPGVLALTDGVDLLIHDAQYTDAEFAKKFDWGHCTTDYALEVARQAGAKRLALFHHDPSRDDADLDVLAKRAAAAGARMGLAEVICAREGMRISLAPVAAQ